MSCSHKSHLKGSGEPLEKAKSLEVYPYSSCAPLMKINALPFILVLKVVTFS